MVYAAPSLRFLDLPRAPRFIDEWSINANSLADVKAARGGLDGGDMDPERTSGIPLCPASTGSGVMESGKTSGTINDIAAGEDVGLSANYLTATITITTAVFHTLSHCSR